MINKARQLCILLLLFTITTLRAQKIYEITFWDYNKPATKNKKKILSSIEIYNTDDLLVEVRNGPLGDSLCDRTVFGYNAKKQKVSESQYYFGNHLSVTRNFGYDESGLLKTITYKSRNKKGDRFVVTESFFYNENGLLTLKIKTADCCVSPEKWTYTYQQTGDTKKVTWLYYYANKKNPKRKITVYNSKGSVISEASDGELTTYKYEYDQDGEWTVKKVCTRLSKIGPWICEGEFKRTLVQK